MIDRGLDLMAQTIVALARNPNLSQEEAEHYATLSMVTYLQVSGLLAPIEPPKLSDLISGDDLAAHASWAGR